ncbi:sensor histidine kinase [Nocardia sp. CDC160]|uniref:sensor histidine kinase n=1 Tax=Nocardia sp. CDC160 TaxID=3112166 RepID=UPI002DBBBD80|nr:sensor histidine kinase [Nocardia sp. CDC160]MEC3917658.1 sensor histidine kinase [Nocardia sp. CDC160]
MNQDNAVLLSWVLATALVLAVVGLLLLWRAVRAERGRVAALRAEQTDRDAAVEEMIANLTDNVLPAIGAAVRRSDPDNPTVDLPIVLERTRIAELVWQWTARCGEELLKVATETRDRVRREAETETQLALAQVESERQTAVAQAEEMAQLAIAQAEEAARVAVAQANEAARTAADEAAAAARAQVESTARDATSAAVRAFGASVVSLGADVSQVLSAALRKHRNDETFETLTRIDHSVQQMIRQAQSYVIVCGGLPGRRWPQQTLTDVVGGATGRVRDYTRVRATELDRPVISRVVEPLVHTLATLLDNALRYSPPTSFVDIGFQEGHHGVTVIIDDAGVRMNPEQLEETRRVLAGDQVVDIHALGPTPRVGFPGVAALARRYGFSIYIDGPNMYGGMRAMVFIPETLLAAPAPAVVAAPTPVPAPAPAPAPDPEPTVVAMDSAPTDLTPGGLPKRRRRSATVSVAATVRAVEADSGSARPEIAAAWYSGSRRGRAAAFEHSEGMTS